eukprot:6723792-Ditylum_brightwellii.AAC.1
MNISGTFSAPCQCTDLPSGAKVLCTQPAFKAKLQNIPKYCKIYTCTVTNDLSQIEDIGFDVSYLQVHLTTSE